MSTFYWPSPRCSSWPQSKPALLNWFPSDAIVPWAVSSWQLAPNNLQHGSSEGKRPPSFSTDVLLFSAPKKSNFPLPSVQAPWLTQRWPEVEPLAARRSGGARAAFFFPSLSLTSRSAHSRRQKAECRAARNEKQLQHQETMSRLNNSGEKQNTMI